MPDAGVKMVILAYKLKSIAFRLAAVMTSSIAQVGE